jgi:MGT family glycosyltransferase
VSKIVFLSIPAHGHVNPTLPVVQELVRRGEQVLYYNNEEFRPQIEQAGATFRAYPATEMTPTAISKALQDGNPANFSVMVLRSTEQILTFLLKDLPAEHSDLIMFDSLALWGKMGATMLKVRGGASITHFVIDLPWSSMNLSELFRMLRQGLPKVPQIVAARMRLIRRFGKEAFPPAQPLFPMRDKLNIVFTARELQPEMSLIDETFRFVGPSILPQSRDGGFSWDRVSKTPVIYMSLGTIHHASADLYKDCFQSFKEFPAQFILSVGRELDMAALGTIPANCVVRSFVPQLEVLQYTDVFITHGGMNSVHEGLYYGVPLIVIPHHFEQFINAQAVEAHGAGIMIDSQRQRGHFTAVELQRALETMFAEPHYRLAAQKVQKILRATGGYQQAADEIQAYLAKQ